MSTLAMDINGSTNEALGHDAGLVPWGRHLPLFAGLDVASRRQHPGKDSRVTPVNFEDARDIEAGRSGDGEAFGRLIRRYQDEIGRYMWRFSRDRNAWEELVQDVFVQAYLSLDGYRARSPFVHWLRRIATRVGYRYWRTRDRRSCEVPMIAEATTAPDTLQPSEAAERLHAMLARLAPRDRLVLTLMYLEDLPVTRIAELTGWTKTLVKVQAHRARARLRKLIEQEERG